MKQKFCLMPCLFKEKKDFKIIKIIKFFLCSLNLTKNKMTEEKVLRTQTDIDFWNRWALYFYFRFVKL